MTTWLVTAFRATLYKVEAEDRESAIDAMIDGQGEEIDGVTERITAEPYTKEEARVG